MDGHSPSIRTVGRGGSVAKLVNTGDDAAKRVVAGSRDREAYLSCKVSLPGRCLATKGVVLVACRQPRDVGHVKRDEARRGGYATFVVVVPSRRRAVGLDLRNLMTAVPRRGRHLTDEVFERRALTFGIVCHAVSGNSIPYSIDERLGARFDFFATNIGNRDVAGSLAGDRRGGLFVEVGDSAYPAVG